MCVNTHLRKHIQRTQQSFLNEFPGQRAQPSRWVEAGVQLAPTARAMHPGIVLFHPMKRGLFSFFFFPIPCKSEEVFSLNLPQGSASLLFVQRHAIWLMMALILEIYQNICKPTLEVKGKTKSHPHSDTSNKYFSFPLLLDPYLKAVML